MELLIYFHLQNVSSRDQFSIVYYLPSSTGIVVDLMLFDFVITIVIKFSIVYYLPSSTGLVNRILLAPTG